MARPICIGHMKRKMTLRRCGQAIGRFGRFSTASYLTFNLSLVGGRRYGTADGPLYINETYPLLISPSGTELLVGEGENGANLPFMSQSTIACVLTQIEE